MSFGSGMVERSMHDPPISRQLDCLFEAKLYYSCPISVQQIERNFADFTIFGLNRMTSGGFQPPEATFAGCYHDILIGCYRIPWKIPIPVEPRTS
jgi:hypothetical protein